jgi:hypothetical protein
MARKSRLSASHIKPFRIEELQERAKSLSAETYRALTNLAELYAFGSAFMDRLELRAQQAGQSLENFLESERTRLRQKAAEMPESEYCLEPEEFAELAAGTLSHARQAHFDECAMCRALYECAPPEQQAPEEAVARQLAAKAAASRELEPA